MEASKVENPVDVGLTVPEFVAENGPDIDRWARERDHELLGDHRGTILHEVPILGEYRDEAEEQVATTMRRNFDDAVSHVAELTELKLGRQLEEGYAKGGDTDISRLNRLLIEKALLKLVRHKLRGEADSNTFHPKSHVRLQLNDDAPGKRLAVVYAIPETEDRDDEEYTFKRAIVYDPAKPEGWRFYGQERGVSKPRVVDCAALEKNGEPEHPLEDGIEMEQSSHPVSTSELLKMLRLLAESNSPRPEPHDQETE